LSELMPINAP